MSLPISDDRPAPLDHSSVSAPDRDRTPRRPIRCDCGRALIVKVSRERVILRCPIHGIQFRYTPEKDK